MLTRTQLILSLFFLSLSAGAACTKPAPERGCLADQDCPGAQICSTGVGCILPDQAPDIFEEPDIIDERDTSAAPDAADPQDALSPEDTAPDQDTTDEIDVSPPECPADLPEPRGTAQARGVQPAAAIQVDPLTRIRLSAQRSRPGAADIAEYHWEFTDYPYRDEVPGTRPRLLQDSDGSARFDANNFGTYILELSLTDADGNQSCAPHQIVVEAKSDARIFVEMVWDTPGAPANPTQSSDLDLHYRHPEGDWGFPDSDLDIFWHVPTADWGIPGDPSDDPHLLSSTEAAPGPESLIHPNADPLTYSVGVYYYDDAGWGPSYVTIRAYLDGELAGEIQREEMPAKRAFFEALSIDAATNSVTYDEQHYDDYPPPRH